MFTNQQGGFLLINFKILKIMIRSKKEIYNLRNNTTSKIYVEVIAETNDFANEKFIFQVSDYILDNGQKKAINSKYVELSYIQRDALKDTILQTNNLSGTESDVNKLLIPFALPYLTSQDPIYNQDSTEWELNY